MEQIRSFISKLRKRRGYQLAKEDIENLNDIAANTTKKPEVNPHALRKFNTFLFVGLTLHRKNKLEISTQNYQITLTFLLGQRQCTLEIESNILCIYLDCC